MNRLRLPRSKKNQLVSVCCIVLAPWSIALSQEGREELTLRSIARMSQIGDVQFSPDGRRIAFISNRSGIPKIWVIGATGGEPKMLTPGSEGEFSPQWSPDATRIAFLSIRGGQSDIWTVSSEGGDPVRVTPPHEIKQAFRLGLLAPRDTLLSRRLIRNQ